MLSDGQVSIVGGVQSSVLIGSRLEISKYTVPAVYTVMTKQLCLESLVPETTLPNSRETPPGFFLSPHLRRLSLPDRELFFLAPCHSPQSSFLRRFLHQYYVP